MAAKILVVDDEQDLRDLMTELLVEQGYESVSAADGREGLRTFFSWQPDLTVLDIMMPGMDGWNLLERIREVSEAPVIFLTALGREHERVRGLKSGADDYVVKPFRTAEFLARVEAVLRRAGTLDQTAERYEDAALMVDFPGHQVYVSGDRVELTPREFRLLAALIRNANLVMSTERLLDLCWGDARGGPENVRVYIGYLRKKIEADPKRPRRIETVREFGYRYRPPEPRS